MYIRRNVGLPFTVERSYFVEIKTMTTMLGFEHVEPFVAILAKSPRSAYLKKANPRNVVMSSTFMVNIVAYSTICMFCHIFQLKKFKIVSFNADCCG